MQTSRQVRQTGRRTDRPVVVPRFLTWGTDLIIRGSVPKKFPSIVNHWSQTRPTAFSWMLLHEGLAWDKSATSLHAVEIKYQSEAGNERSSRLKSKHAVLSGCLELLNTLLLNCWTSSLTVITFGNMGFVRLSGSTICIAVRYCYQVFSEFKISSFMSPVYSPRAAWSMTCRPISGIRSCWHCICIGGGGILLLFVLLPVSHERKNWFQIWRKSQLSPQYVLKPWSLKVLFSTCVLFVHFMVVMALPDA